MEILIYIVWIEAQALTRNDSNIQPMLRQNQTKGSTLIHGERAFPWEHRFSAQSLETSRFSHSVVVKRPLAMEIDNLGSSPDASYDH